MVAAFFVGVMLGVMVMGVTSSGVMVWSDKGGRCESVAKHVTVTYRQAYRNVVGRCQAGVTPELSVEQYCRLSACVARDRLDLLTPTTDEADDCYHFRNDPNQQINIQTRQQFLSYLEKIRTRLKRCDEFDAASSTPTATPTPEAKVKQNEDNKKNEGMGGLALGLIIGGALLGVGVLGFVIYHYKLSPSARKKKKHEVIDTDMNQISIDFLQGSNYTGSTPILGDDEELVRLFIDPKELQYIKRLIRGTFGEVWVGEYRDQYVALKKFLIPEMEQIRGTAKFDQLSRMIRCFANEVKLMSTLSHPRIIHLIGCTWTSLYDFTAITEFMPRGDLCMFLGLMHEEQHLHVEAFSWVNKRLKIALEILEGLIYLHKSQPKKVIHRDLKSRNVLLDAQTCVKLTDFGTSRHLLNKEQDTMTGGIGTIMWMAPEILSNERSYTEKVDIYSFGVILTELDTLKLPYAKQREENEMTMVQLPHLITSGKIRPEVSEKCPAVIQRIVARCLDSDPEKRPSAEELHIELLYSNNSQNHLYR